MIPVNKDKINVAIEELTTSRNRYNGMIPVAKHQSDLEAWKYRKESIDEVLNLLIHIDELTPPVKVEPKKTFLTKLLLRIRK